MSDPNPQVDRLSEERIARNDARFRRANEQIEAAALELDQGGLLPFLCECADRTCTDVIQLSIHEYEEIRADSRRFVNAIGHHVAAHGTVTIVSENDRYEVVEKLGHAGEVAERLDERASEDSQAAGQ